jgi:hypothetical protein
VYIPLVVDESFIPSAMFSIAETDEYVFDPRVLVRPLLIYH